MLLHTYDADNRKCWSLLTKLYKFRPLHKTGGAVPSAAAATCSMCELRCSYKESVRGSECVYSNRPYVLTRQLYNRVHLHQVAYNASQE